jgi:hypothetical protein
MNPRLSGIWSILNTNWLWRLRPWKPPAPGPHMNEETTQAAPEYTMERGTPFTGGKLAPYFVACMPATTRQLKLKSPEEDRTGRRICQKKRSNGRWSGHNSFVCEYSGWPTATTPNRVHKNRFTITKMRAWTRSYRMETRVRHRRRFSALFFVWVFVQSVALSSIYVCNICPFDSENRLIRWCCPCAIF